MSKMEVEEEEEEIRVDPVVKEELEDLGRKLEEKANKVNFSAKNVKAIIKHVFTSNMMKRMISAANGPRKKKAKMASRGKKGAADGEETAEEGGGGVSSDEEFSFEPKLTRAKVKELIQSDTNIPEALGASLLTIFSSPAKKDKGESFISKEFPEDEDEDEEYDPSKDNDKGDHSDDDSCSLASHDATDASDFGGSPRFSTPNSSGKRAKRQEPLIRSARLVSKELFKSPPPKKQLEAKNEPGIGLRTRSKVPLTDTSIEKLEASFIPPDISTDMYDWNSKEEDNEDYLQFLQDFILPAGSSAGNNETNDDEDGDPEYNVMEDEEEHDREELRVDRAVKITKKELNSLISELIGDVSFEEEMDIENKMLQISNSTSKKSSSSIATQASTNKKNNCNTVTFIPNPGTSSFQSSKPDLIDLDKKIDKLAQDLNEGGITAIQNTRNNAEVQTTSAQPPPPSTSLPSTSQNGDNTNDSNVLFTPQSYGILQDQIRRHVQLLAQTYVLTAPYPSEGEAREMARQSKAMIIEINNLGRANSSNGRTSAFNVWNLSYAYGLIHSWPLKRIKDSRTPLKKRILEETLSKVDVIPDLDKVKNFPLPFIRVFCENPTFMYTPLLPKSCNQMVRGSSPFFTDSEDALIAYGLDGLSSDLKSTLKQKIPEIVRILVPGRTVDNIYNRIRNLRKKSEPNSNGNTTQEASKSGIKSEKPSKKFYNPNSPLYKYLKNNEIPPPQSFPIATIEDVIPPMLKHPKSLDSQWTVLTNLYKKYKEDAGRANKTLVEKSLKALTALSEKTAADLKKEAKKNELKIELTSPKGEDEEEAEKDEEESEPKRKRRGRKPLSNKTINSTALPNNYNREMLEKENPGMTALPLYKDVNGAAACYALVPSSIFVKADPNIENGKDLNSAPSQTQHPPPQVKPLNLSPKKKFNFSESPKRIQFLQETHSQMSLEEFTISGNSPLNLSKKGFQKSKSFPVVSHLNGGGIVSPISSYSKLDKIFKRPYPVTTTLKKRPDEILQVVEMSSTPPQDHENSQELTKTRSFPLLKPSKLINIHQAKPKSAFLENFVRESETVGTPEKKLTTVRPDIVYENAKIYHYIYKEEEASTPEEPATLPSPPEPVIPSPTILNPPQAPREEESEEDEEEEAASDSDSEYDVKSQDTFMRQEPSGDELVLSDAEENEGAKSPLIIDYIDLEGSDDDDGGGGRSILQNENVKSEELEPLDGGEENQGGQDSGKTSSSKGGGGGDSSSRKGSSKRSKISEFEQESMRKDDDDDGEDEDKHPRGRKERIPEDKVDFEKKGCGGKDEEDSEADEERETSPPRKSGGSKKNPKHKKSPLSSTTKKRPSKYKVTSMEQMLDEREREDGGGGGGGGGDEEEGGTSGLAQVEYYLTKVQARVDPNLYKQFFNLMREYAQAEEEQNPIELYYKVEKMFKDHPEIIREFVGILQIEDAVEINRLMDFHESRSYVNFMGLLEKWTLNCPQLKTRILGKFKSLKDLNATEEEIIRAMEPLLKENILVFEAFKALFPSLPVNPSTSRYTDFEDIDIERLEEQGLDPSEEVSQAELIQLPPEKRVPATNTCPCTCHEDALNISYKIRIKHCYKCSLKFQDGKIMAHYGRTMKPVSVAFTKAPQPSTPTPKESPP